MERNIIFGCDGTANHKGRDAHHTNVVHLLRRIPTHSQQIAAYEPGVGTFSPLGLPRDNLIAISLG